MKLIFIPVRTLKIIFLMFVLFVGLEVEAKYLSSQPKAVSGKIINAPIEYRGKYQRDYYKNFSYARWLLGNFLVLDAIYTCDVEYILGFWPVMSECYGELRPNLSIDRLNNIEDKLNLKKRGVDEIVSNYLDSIARRNERLDLILLNQDMRSYGNRGVFDDVYKNDDNIVIGGGVYSLEKFNLLTEDAILEVRKGVADEINKEKFILILKILMSLFVFGICCYLLYVLYFVGVKKIASWRLVIKNSIAEIKDNHQKRVVRSVVIDETIREMTRNALSEVDDKNKEFLKNEIKNRLMKDK